MNKDKVSVCYFMRWRGWLHVEMEYASVALRGARSYLRHEIIDAWAIVRADGIVIASSRLTKAQTRALYAVIGRAETGAA